jgi:carboxymethylenebutenolidase
MSSTEQSYTRALRAETIFLAGHDGDEIEAYEAVPLDGEPGPGVVVVHHGLGYDEPSHEITRKLAAHGYAAIMPNLNWRVAPGASSDDAAAAARAAGGVPDDQVVGDIAAATARLRDHAQAGARVAVLGFCSGGRQAFLAACRLPVQAIIECYGAYIVPTAEGSWPGPATPVVTEVDQLSGPLLGLSGSLDQYPSPAAVTELEGYLKAAGKPCEFHVFDGAKHGFMATNRPNYSPLAAGEGWALIWDFLDRTLRA